jgi:hypothetical protein
MKMECLPGLNGGAERFPGKYHRSGCNFPSHKTRRRTSEVHNFSTQQVRKQLGAMEQRNLFKCQDFINGLNIIFVEEAPVTTIEQPTNPPAATELIIRDASAQKKDNPDAATISACATCKKSFSNLEEQQTHYKSNWHRYATVFPIESDPAIFPPSNWSPKLRS